MTDATLEIRSRFRGPPSSANGGYCCGCLATLMSNVTAPALPDNTPVEVTLRSPPPLDTPMNFEGTELRHGEVLVATSRQSQLELELPSPVTSTEAEACSENYIGRRSHLFPECFVCGPARAAGDGLRIFPGRRAELAPVAAPWVPDASLVDSGSNGAPSAQPPGSVTNAVVWAALDCPGYFGVVQRPVKALLGRMSAVVQRPVIAGEQYVVMAWGLGIEGRKMHAGSALWTAAGQLVARSRQTWITL